MASTPPPTSHGLMPSSPEASLAVTRARAVWLISMGPILAKRHRMPDVSATPRRFTAWTSVRPSLAGVTLLAVLFAAGSALTTALSTAIQHHSASTVAVAPGTGRTGLVRSLVRRPAWLFALSLGPVGFTLHALALQNGPIALVQPIVIVGIVVALPLSTFFAGTRTRARDLRAALATVAALAVFLLASDPRAAHAPPTTLLAWAVSGTAAAAVAAIALSTGVRRRAGRAALLGTASGLLFGLMAVLVEVLTGRLDAGSSWLSLALDWLPYAMAAAGVGGLVVNQFAYRTAGLAASMPILNVVNCLTTLAFGYLVLGEQVNTDPLSALVAGLALVVIVRGLWVLSGDDGPAPGPVASPLTSPAVAAVAQVSGRGRRRPRRTSSTSSPAGPSARARATSGY